VLSKMGYNPDTASNGHDALELISVKNYDLVLMDVQMPEMDGMEATRIIRSSERKQPTIIAMTANAMEKDRQLCLESGMDDFLSKPIKLEDMISTIKRWATIIADTSESHVD
jgi:CheY-like chemotaxis protein